MNKFIEEELKKCKVADIEILSDTEILIKQRKKTELQLNNYYIIELENYIIHPNINFTLAENWNKGIIPKSKYLKCMIIQIMGKMIKIDGSGYDIENNNDLNDVYLGLWLPMAGVKIIKQL